MSVSHTLNPRLRDITSFRKSVTPWTQQCIRISSMRFQQTLSVSPHHKIRWQRSFLAAQQTAQLTHQAIPQCMSSLYTLSLKIKSPLTSTRNSMCVYSSGVKSAVKSIKINIQVKNKLLVGLRVKYLALSLPSSTEKAKKSLIIMTPKKT